MKNIYSLDSLSELNLKIETPSLIFLYWDLWAGKTTLSQMIIQKLLDKKMDITSPTYVYYNKYEDIYHFDLYRLSEYEEFVSIAWEEILDNNLWVILVEWPEKIAQYYCADIEIYLKKTQSENEREVEIVYKNL